MGDARLGYLFCWDGISPQGVGHGVDGSVRSIVSYRDMLIVGGAFRRAFQSDGNGLLHTGNLGTEALGRSLEVQPLTEVSAL